MKTGVAVFAYNRNQHLQKVLDGLRKNVEVDEMYVFQDGLKNENHREGWEKTKCVIEHIDWCKVKYRLSPFNKGLAQSIVDGINTVFEENDAIIVLEDDCVPTDNFISYMLQCFEKYRDIKKIYNVTGYSLPIVARKEEYDIYFTGRTSSWGWGTWKDRWEQYSKDNDILSRVQYDKEKSRFLAIWGNDLEEMLKGRISGQNDSWAVYWALKVIEMQGVCIAPYVSLIQNIGFDGSGVHCKKEERYNVNAEINHSKHFRFPDKIEFLYGVEKEFATFFGGYTAINFIQNKENILIYGLGGFFKKNEKKINDMYYIKAFIDREKGGFYAGKKIIKAADIVFWNYSRIIVMIEAEEEYKEIQKMLVEEYAINMDSVFWGKELLGTL